MPPSSTFGVGSARALRRRGLAVLASVAVAGGCTGDDARRMSSGEAASTQARTDGDAVLSIEEASERRPRTRVTVEGALHLALVPKERVRLCAAISFSGAEPRCERPAFAARLPRGALTELESTPDGWFAWSPRPMRFVGSFRGGIFRIDEIVG